MDKTEYKVRLDNGFIGYVEGFSLVGGYREAFEFPVYKRTITNLDTFKKIGGVVVEFLD